MPKRAAVPGLKAKRSYKIPKCSVDESHPVQRNDRDEWFCVTCADEWLGRFVESKTHGTSVGGIALPAGVQDDRRATPHFRDVMPNRATRRRMRRG